MTNQVFRDIDALARESHIPTYDPKTGVGFWRHLVIRRAKKTGEMMIIFSVNGVFESDKMAIQGTKEYILTSMVQQLSKKYDSIASIYFLENTGRADIVQ